jgi:murein DD-endopeptidase MepM/ murein hydrolase activator NlpD
MRVEKGDVIGLMGKSGVSKGIHLHYEIRLNDKPVNPINYLRGQVE